MSGNPPEGEAPAPIPYARVGQAAGWRPAKPPGPCLRAALICAAVSAVAEIVSLALPGGALALTVVLTALLAPVGLILATMAVVRNCRVELAPSERQPGKWVWGMLAAALAVLFLQMALAMAALGHAREYAKSAVSAANLRGIGQGAAIYANEHGVYPSSLDDLVVAGHVSPRLFFSFSDRARAGVGTGPPYYSSFVYRPGAGPWQTEGDLVVAYERTASTPRDTSIFPKRARLVLFGDGHVQPLDEREFREALAKDEQRRRELGWPMPARP